MNEETRILMYTMSFTLLIATCGLFLLMLSSCSLRDDMALMYEIESLNDNNEEKLEHDPLYQSFDFPEEEHHLY